MIETSLGDLLRQAVPDGRSPLRPEQVLRSARRRQAGRRAAGAGLAVAVAAVAVPLTVQLRPDATPARLATVPAATPTAPAETPTPAAGPTADRPSLDAAQVRPPAGDDGHLGTILVPPVAATSLGLGPDERVADLLATTTVSGRSLHLVGVVRGGQACTVQFADDPEFIIGPGLCEPADRTVTPGDVYTSHIQDWTSTDPERSIVNGTAPAGTRYVRIESARESVELPVGHAGPRWHEQVFFITPVTGTVTDVVPLDEDREPLTPSP